MNTGMTRILYTIFSLENFVKNSVNELKYFVVISFISLYIMKKVKLADFITLFKQ